MSLEFEWDAEKARTNAKKHGISFEEAAVAFGDPLSITIPDPDHSKAEDRFVLIGSLRGNKLVVVVHTERGSRIRIISARSASKHERKMYEG